MIACPVCGLLITVEEGYVLLEDHRVIHSSCILGPWAEGDIKDAAAPADKEQEDGK